MVRVPPLIISTSTGALRQRFGRPETAEPGTYDGDLRLSARSAVNGRGLQG